jgi:phage baseplate assembly protein W
MASTSPYGWDLSCVDDLDPSMLEVGGNVVLAQACARRLITPRGTYVGDANYGFDLRQFIDDDVSQAQVAKIQAAIQQELLKDARVQTVTATAKLNESTSVMTVTAIIQGAAGPFSFVLTVGALAATIAVQP